MKLITQEVKINPLMKQNIKKFIVFFRQNIH